MSSPEPSDDELVAFAELLLRKVDPQLRERRVLDEAIQQHRATWLTLYGTARALKGLGAAGNP